MVAGYSGSVETRLYIPSIAHGWSPRRPAKIDVFHRCKVIADWLEENKIYTRG